MIFFSILTASFVLIWIIIAVSDTIPVSGSNGSPPCAEMLSAENFLKEVRRTFPNYGISSIFGWCIYCRNESPMSWQTATALLIEIERAHSNPLRDQNNEPVEWLQEFCFLVFGKTQTFDAALAEIVNDFETGRRVTSSRRERLDAIEQGRSSLGTWIREDRLFNANRRLTVMIFLGIVTGLGIVLALIIW